MIAENRRHGDSPTDQNSHRSAARSRPPVLLLTASHGNRRARVGWLEEIPGGVADVPQYQRHCAADDDHRLIATAELVHENLGTRMFLDAMVSRRYREQYIDTLSCYLRDQELAGLDILHRRRLPLRRRCRRPKLDQLSAASHERLRAWRSASDTGRARRNLVSARAYPA